VTPLGELTALPQTSSLNLMGPTSKGRKREGVGNKTGEGRCVKMGWSGKRNGRGKEGRKGKR